ncbi:MAG TPA: MBL fold metallo-hydrolase [Actinomycetota bacterium]|nr:MBL fold metallo-hydrolase [Actinomycetota bacterium]
MTSEQRHPSLTPVADGVTMIDTVMTGEPEFNAVFVLDGDEPTLVETGPGADLPVVLEALEVLGIGKDDLAHVVVTHIHLDHAGAAGALASRFSNAIVWAHMRGAPHLADPARLIASTARTYGEPRMQTFFGQTEPVPAERLRAVSDGDTIRLGRRALAVVHTPGHASHHVALHDLRSGALFSGEAIGSHLPWGPAFRPALPPPEVDVEAALDSIERIRGRAPLSLLASHFGPVPDVDEACDAAAERIRSWSHIVRCALERDHDADVDTVTAELRSLAASEFEAETGRPIDMARYDAIGSIAMNAAGLSRYWRKRWEREREPES